MLPPGQAERPGERLHTLVLRNLPIRTKQEELLACMHALGFRGRYNFFHMPLRNRQRQNKGYAFVGFFDLEVAASFRHAMDGYRIESRQSDKVIVVEPARQQTYQSMVEPDHSEQWQELMQAMDQLRSFASSGQHGSAFGVVSL